MKVFALCLESSVISVRKASGAAPLTSPPVTIDTFDPRQFSGYGFYYFKLHGLPEEHFWYGDDYITACSAEQLAACDMAGAIVFIANCHALPLPDEDPSPMIQALFAAGAVAIVAGPGENYARTRTIAGADRLGKTFRMLTCSGMDPTKAFQLAKLQLQAIVAKRALGNKNTHAGEDTLEFKLITNPKGLEHP